MNEKLILIGESCVDRVLSCTHERMSPEDPTVPVYKQTNITETLGMLCLVRQYLYKKKLAFGVFSNPSTEIVKTRVFVSGKQMFRLDEDNQVALGVETDIPELRTTTPEYIAISDYGKGLLSLEVIKIVNEKATQGAKVMLDPHPKNPIGQYKNVFVLKLNDKEVMHFTGQKDFRIGAHILRSQLNCEHLFVTLGKDGMYYCGPTECHYMASKAVVINNVSGAGDLVFAALIEGFVNRGETQSSIVDIMARATEQVASYIETPLCL